MSSSFLDNQRNLDDVCVSNSYLLNLPSIELNTKELRFQCREMDIDFGGKNYLILSNADRLEGD